MKFALIMSAALLSFAPGLSFAADCNCSKQCIEDCKNGKAQNCDCEHCDCKHGKGECASGHCDHKKQ